MPVPRAVAVQAVQMLEQRQYTAVLPAGAALLVLIMLLQVAQQVREGEQHDKL